MVTPRFPAWALHGWWYGGMACTRVAPHYSEQKKTNCCQHDPSNTERWGESFVPVSLCRLPCIHNECGWDNQYLKDACCAPYYLI